METAYYKTKESVAEYVSMCKDDEPTPIIPKFLTFINTQDKILELGSGAGIDWELLHQTHTIIGSDYSEKFIHYLQVKFPTGDFLVLDAISLETTQIFNAIYSNKVLHYLSNEDLTQSIKNQVGILEPKGLICHTFWKGEGCDNFKGLFVQYHNKTYLKEIFSPYFEILVLENYTEYDDEDSILLIARKK